jgi:magnesium transporter
LSSTTAKPPVKKQVVKLAGQGRSATSARLFDADRVDRELELGPNTAAGLTDRQLLWVDLVVAGEPAESPSPLEWLPFDAAEIARAWAAPTVPRLTVHGDYFLARLVVLRTERGRDVPETLDLAVGKNVVLTAHRKAIPFLAELNGRITADTSLGEIDSADFASVLLDGLITGYLEMTDAILARVDELDGEALKSSGGHDLLSELVSLRHRIAATRRALVSHRSVMVAMAGVDFEVVTSAEAGPRFVEVTDRFDGAVDAIDAAREALIGTFDIHMSRTAQRTNDVMKILTITSVLLLPTGVIAGFMGMNIQAPYSNDDPTIFWYVVAIIVIVAIGTLLTLRLRRWL